MSTEDKKPDESQSPSTSVGGDSSSSEDRSNRISQVLSLLSTLSQEERASLGRMDVASGGALLSSPVTPGVPSGSFASSGRTIVRRLKHFSGRQPTPGNEVNFMTWRLLVLQYLEDETVHDPELKTCILESLSGPALDMVQPCILNRTSTAQDVFKLLDTMYGKVETGYELVIKFYEMIQTPKQSASDYLQTLYIHLVEAVEQGGIQRGDQDRYLTRQFLRGCRDEYVLSKLDLQESNPLPFTDLLRLIRATEATRQERLARFGKSAVCASLDVDDRSEAGSLKDYVSDLERQVKDMAVQNKSRSAAVNDLTSQVQQLQVGASKERGATSAVPTSQQKKQKKFHGFCYRCGKDGHVAWKCKCTANPSLVQENLAQAEKKRKSQQTHPN